MSRGIVGAVLHYGDRRMGPGGTHDVPAIRVADADEDHVTLAVGALRHYLDDRDAADVHHLVLVGRFTEEDGQVVREAAGHPDVTTTLVAGSGKAGLKAMMSAHGDDVEGITVVVASDDGRDEATSAWHHACAALVAIGDGAGFTRRSRSERPGPIGDPARRGALVSEALELLTGFDGTNTPVVGNPPDPALNLDHFAGSLVAFVRGLAAHTKGDLAWATFSKEGVVCALFGGVKPPRVDAGDGSGPGTDIDPAAAGRARTAWLDGGRPAQGAFVSRQTYLANGPARYRWVGQSCDACGCVIFPPRESCPSCSKATLSPLPLSGKGEVYARTQIGAGGAPTEFAPLQEATGPYSVFIVELAEGPRVAAMGTAATTALPIGAPVSLQLRLLYVQDGLARYGFKAAPAL